MKRLYSGFDGDRVREIYDAVMGEAWLDEPRQADIDEFVDNGGDLSPLTTENALEILRTVWQDIQRDERR